MFYCESVQYMYYSSKVQLYYVPQINTQVHRKGHLGEDMLKQFWLIIPNGNASWHPHR